MSPKLLIFPAPLVGGGTIYSNVFFFCSVNFGRSIYSSQRNVSGIIKKLVQRRIQNKKRIFRFSLFSRSYRGLKFCVNTGYLFTFRVIFLQIKIFFFIKNSISNLNFLPKMNQFWVSNRLKAIKETSSGLIGSFNIKKFRNFESSFF